MIQKYTRWVIICCIHNIKLTFIRSVYAFWCVFPCCSSSSSSTWSLPLSSDILILEFIWKKMLSLQLQFITITCDLLTTGTYTVHYSFLWILLYTHGSTRVHQGVSSQPLSDLTWFTHSFDYQEKIPCYWYKLFHHCYWHYDYYNVILILKAIQK